jgi:hypothetical protein
MISFKIELLTAYKLYPNQLRTMSSTIRVLSATLSSGYAPILAYYNTNKPAHWLPMNKAAVCEGGFEIPLNAEELARLKERSSGALLDQNDYVRQLRWHNGTLVSFAHSPLREEEIHLLGSALAAVLGADKVQIIKN